MIVDRYYYQQLNKQEQAIYKAFYQGVRNTKRLFQFPLKALFRKMILDVYFWR